MIKTAAIGAYPFQLPPLPYAYDALEPHIDAETVHYHHDKHFKTYLDNLNKVVFKYPALQSLTLAQLLTLEQPATMPDDDYTAIKNNAGGSYNHMIYFASLAPAVTGSHIPTGLLSSVIAKTYGSFEAFKARFTESALGVFGSGYACLCVLPEGKLDILQLKNQDTALTKNAATIMLCDVWEHAYYLKHKNARKDYIENFWQVVTFPSLD